VLPPGTWKPWIALAWPWNPLISMTGSILAAQAINAVLGLRKAPGGRLSPKA
jgi:hypothetical protein